MSTSIKYCVCIFVLCLVLPAQISAQKIKLVTGSLGEVKNESTFAIQFTYDSMMVGTDTPERKYLQQKKADWELKEPGKGAEFIHQWFDDREEYYQPVFISNFEKYSKTKVVDNNTKYTLVVKIKRMEGGWYGGVMGHPGEIDGELHVVDSSNPAHSLAVVEFREIHGKAMSGGDFEMYLRIKDAYAVAGKWLGDFIRKKSK